MAFRLLFPAALVAVCALAACGVDGTSGSASGDGSPSEVSGDVGQEPDIQLPEGAPPGELVIEDIVVGDGAEAAPGGIVTIHYVGVSWTNRQPFDSSWARGAPATFSLDRLIPGWQEGIPGMKVGGRRVLIIPPDLGYGPQGSPPDIAPNDTLYFVIDLLEVG